MTHMQRGKARYEGVAQDVLGQMYLDDESPEAIPERIFRNLCRMTRTEEGSIDRANLYKKIAGDAILGVVGERTSEQK